MADICEITIGKMVHIGTMPLIPTRQRLSLARHVAFGYTPDDLKHWDGDNPEPPTHIPNDQMLESVYAAAFGLCWPKEMVARDDTGRVTSSVPSFASLRYDVDAYGEEVRDFWYRTGKVKYREMITEGRRLCNQMINEYIKLIAEDVQREKDFSEAQGDSSTSVSVVSG